MSENWLVERNGWKVRVGLHDRGFHFTVSYIGTGSISWVMTADGTRLTTLVNRIHEALTLREPQENRDFTVSPNAVTWEFHKEPEGGVAYPFSLRHTCQLSSSNEIFSQTTKGTIYLTKEELNGLYEFLTE